MHGPPPLAIMKHRPAQGEGGEAPHGWRARLLRPGLGAKHVAVGAWALFAGLINRGLATLMLPILPTKYCKGQGVCMPAT